MNEVLSLAKTMEVKFSVSGPAIVLIDPNDPRKKAFCNVGTKPFLH
jgi:hypothetical protein